MSIINLPLIVCIHRRSPLTIHWEIAIGLLVSCFHSVNLIFVNIHFYRAMHFSAKRGIAIACRLSVRPSVCDVGEL